MKALDAPWRAGYRLAHRLLLVWWSIRRPTRRGAHVAVWRDDSLLLVRSSYREGLGAPGGWVGRIETPRQAARRELSEEVGIEVVERELDFVMEFGLDFERKRDLSTFFELQLSGDAGVEISIDDREIVSASFYPVGQLLELDLLPHLRIYLEHRDS